MGVLVTRLKLAKIFPGHDWLQATNLSIDWRKGEVTCQKEEKPLVMRTLEGTPAYMKEFLKVFLEGEFRGLPP
jgi:hypothetical protein